MKKMRWKWNGREIEWMTSIWLIYITWDLILMNCWYKNFYILNQSEIMVGMTIKMVIDLLLKSTNFKR